MLAVCLSHMTFAMLGDVSSILSLLRVFITKGYEFYHTLSLAPIEMVIFTLHDVNVA